MQPLRNASLRRKTVYGIELEFHGTSIKCHILVREAGIIRVMFEQDGLREPNSWAVLGSDKANDVPWHGRNRMDLTGYQPVNFEVNLIDENSLLLKTSQLQIDVQLKPFQLVWSTLQGQIFAADRVLHPYLFGQNQSKAVRHYMSRSSTDLFYGLGDKTGPLNHHGRRLRMAMTDALGYDPQTGDPLYKHWPFLLCKSGNSPAYGIFYDTQNSASGVFDLGCEHSNYYGQYRSYEAHDGDLDYYVLFGPRIRDVTAKFLQLTGRTALPPRWSLGYAQTAMPLTDAEDAQTKVSQFVDECIKQQVPLSAFHFGSGYTSIGKKRYVFNWNTQKFPNPQELLSHLHSLGLRLVANVKPCLLNDHPQYTQAEASEAFIKTDTNKTSISQFWDGEGGHLDFTSKSGIDWWQQGLKQAVFGYGFDASWNDNNEYELWDDRAKSAGFGSPIPIDLSRPLQPLLMTRASYEAQLAFTPHERPFVVTRAGSPGIQRYAQTWTGDNTTSWLSLKYNLRMGLTMSLSGMFNIGHDIGGFAGPVPDAELLVRFYQACALHPRFIANSWKADGTVTSPFTHPHITPYIRQAIRLRYRLMPYYYSIVWRATEAHEAIVRPTFYDFEDDAHCFKENDEFMVGPNLLAAPVVEAGERQCRLYLPKGPNGWFCFDDETFYAPGGVVQVAAAINTIPLFAPAGAIIPITDNESDFSRLHDEPSRAVRVFPAPSPLITAKTTFVLVEDDGKSFGYLQGQVTFVHLTLEANEVEIRVSADVKGSAYKLPYESIRVLIPVADHRRVVLQTTSTSDQSLQLVRGTYKPSSLFLSSHL